MSQPSMEFSESSQGTRLQALVEVVRTDLLWYLKPAVRDLVDTYVLRGTEGMGEEQRNVRTAVIEVFARLLEDGEVLLGTAPEGFNDDDRWCGTGGFKASPASAECSRPNTFVVHHTSTLPDISYWHINALGLLRLYMPLYAAGFPFYDGKYRPISSGHLYNGAETFVGYHWLVYPDGRSLHTLKDEYTGFHSGDYKVNCRSVGAALVGDFGATEPTSQALGVLNSLLDDYKPATILAHREVMHAGTYIDTRCPGDTWDLWKSRLILAGTGAIG